jgi:nitroreductase
MGPLEAGKEHKMDYDNLLRLLKERRSIRRFKPDPIPDEYVGRIIEAARWAPSGFNSQPWEFIVVKDIELKDKIVEFVTKYRRAHYQKMELNREPEYGIPWILKPWRPMNWSIAPVFILLFGDSRTRAGLPMPVRFNREKCQSIFISSLASAFLYMHLAATTLGLASQWVSSVKVPLVHCQLKPLLGIPRELEVYDMMPVGFPAQKARPKLMRSKDEMIHYDYCGNEDFRTDEEVNDFIKRTTYWTRATLERPAD